MINLLCRLYRKKISIIKNIIPIDIMKAKLLLEKDYPNSNILIYIQVFLHLKINEKKIDNFFLKESLKDFRSIFNFYNYIVGYSKKFEEISILNKYFEEKNLIGIRKLELSFPLYINNIESKQLLNSVFLEKKVSIIMTVHNEEELILYALKSLFNQTYKNFNVIVVDDASTDTTPIKLMSAKALYLNQLKIITLKKNYGTYIAKNIGITYADGELITFHDADDWAHPQRIYEHVKAHSNAQVKFTISKLVRINKEGYFFSKYVYPLDRLSMVSLMIEREIITEVGYFRKQRIGSDTEYFERLKKFTKHKYVRIDKVLMFCAHKKNSLTTSLITGVNGFTNTSKRQHHWNQWNKWHIQLKKSKVKPYVSFNREDYIYEIYR